MAFSNQIVASLIYEEQKSSVCAPDYQLFPENACLTQVTVLFNAQFREITVCENEAF